jgi:hypothetical protein
MIVLFMVQNVYLLCEPPPPAKPPDEPPDEWLLEPPPENPPPENPPDDLEYELEEELLLNPPFMDDELL